LEESRSFGPVERFCVVAVLAEKRGPESASLFSTPFKFIPCLDHGFCLPILWTTHHENTDHSEDDLHNPALSREGEEVCDALRISRGWKK
jgi:hypothetical protein